MFLNQTVFALGLLGLATATTQAQDAKVPRWADEFEGSRLDYSKWECEVNAFGGGNQELQLYTDRPANVRVENGLLVLEAHRDKPNIQGTQREFSSGRIRSKHRGDWKYARIEVRAKLPRGKGLWPAIWMLPSEEKYGGWAASGEIDILEYKGHEPGKVYGSLHFGGEWPKNRFTTGTYAPPGADFAADFHIYRIDWREGQITWSVDDTPYQTLKQWQSDGAPFPAPFDQPFHLILNLAVGGGFSGDPDNSTSFPQRFEVDYVRVYSIE